MKAHPAMVVILMVCIQSTASWFELVLSPMIVCVNEGIIIVAVILDTIVFLDSVD